MTTRIRRLAAGLTVVAAVLAGTAAATGTALADETSTGTTQPATPGTGSGSGEGETDDTAWGAPPADGSHSFDTAWG